MNSLISPNPQHTLLVERLNAFERVKTSRWARSLVTYLDGCTVALQSAQILIFSALCLTNPHPLLFTLTGLVWGLSAVMVVAWRGNVRKMNTPVGLAEQREDLRKTLMKAYGIIPNSLPVLQEIDARMANADVVWMKYVEHVVKEYMKPYEQSKTVNTAAYDQIMGRTHVEVVGEAPISSPTGSSLRGYL